jgi:hypothetical protein
MPRVGLVFGVKISDRNLYRGSADRPKTFIYKAFGDIDRILFSWLVGKDVGTLSKNFTACFLCCGVG